MFSKIWTKQSTKESFNKIEQLKEKIEEADTIIIGPGAGLSTSAGFTYTGDRFTKYFSDFQKKYGFQDMYSGGFYPFESFEEHWHTGADTFILIDIWMPQNRYMKNSMI